MKKIISILTLIFVLPVYAQERVNIDVKVVSVDGEKRLAFTKEDAKKLLQMRVDFPKLENLAEKQKKSIQNKAKQIGIYEELLTNTQKQIQILGDINTDLAERAIESDKWYNNEWLWFSVGVVLGGGMVAAVAVGAK